jgi:arabinofuranosyltransferase
MMTERRWIALIVCMFLAHVVYLNCLAEDALIALRFARNFARGDGLVWNPGTPPVEGYTDFLWVVLSAAAMRLGLPGVAFVQALSIVAGVATLLVSYDIGRRFIGWPPVVALVPTALLSVSGPMATWSSSGMESTFFTLLLLLASARFARFWREESGRHLHIAALLLVLATLTRPEGLMIAGVLFGVSLAAAVWDRRGALTPLVTAAGLFSCLFAAYFAWRYQRYGYLLPNTFYVKMGGGPTQVLRGGLLTYLFLMQFGLALVPGLLVTAWELGVPRLRRIVRHLTSEGFRRQAFFVFAAAIVLACTGYNLAVGGDYMPMHRFFVPVLPFLYLLFGVPIGALYSRITRPENRRGFSALIAFTLAATFFPSTALERSFYAAPPQQYGAYRGVMIARWHIKRLTLLGKFFDQYRRHASESLATPAIGAIGYYADMAILDIHGLVDTHIAHLPPPPNFGWSRPGHGKRDLPYTFALRPTYVMFSRDLTVKPIDLWIYLPEEMKPTVERDYVHRSVWLEDEGNGERGYFTFFERIDSATQRTATDTRNAQ